MNDFGGNPDGTGGAATPADAGPHYQHSPDPRAAASTHAPWLL